MLRVLKVTLFRPQPWLLRAAMSSKGSSAPVFTERPAPKVTFPEEELRKRLTKEQYYVTQEKGTERAFTGQYVKVKDNGDFNCVVCGNLLFTAEKKFESGTGWPSFTDVAKENSAVRIVDDSHGMERTEVACGQCGAHLGHVFDDGPRHDTGLRYCINSASLKFETKPKKK